MEQLLQVKKGVHGNPAFTNEDHKTEKIQVNQQPNNQLMELFKLIKEGDTKAIETLSIKYIQLVINTAGEFKNNGLTDLELILKGNSGLTKAAENFNESRGIDFNAYAIWSVRQAIIQAIDEKDLVKPLPLNKIGLLNYKKSWYPNHQERTKQILMDL